MKSRLEICTGKQCRKHARSTEKLAALIGDRIEIKQTRCLKVCKKTPIIVLRHGKKTEVFQKIRSKKAQLAFVRYLDTSEMTKPLKQHLREK